MGCEKIILVGCIILSLFLVYYFIFRVSKSESFTALTGLNPLTSYDDYGTAAGIYHFDDLPYYDKGFKSMICGNPDYVPDRIPRLGGIYPDEHADHPDSFIGYQGFKVRRELLGSNYNDLDVYSPASFDMIQKEWLIKKDRPQASSQAPEASNYHIIDPKVFHPSELF